MLVLADPASKVTQIFTSLQKARAALLTFGFFPISPTGKSLPVTQDKTGQIFIDGYPLASYLPPQQDIEALHPYVRPMLVLPSQEHIPYNPLAPEIEPVYHATSSNLGSAAVSQPNLGATGPYRLFLFYPPGSSGCSTANGCFMSGHYDPSLQAGPCNAPDAKEFATLTDLQAYANAHGETLMEVQSDQEIQRVCGMSPSELISRYGSTTSTLLSWLPYLGLAGAAFLFLRKRRS